MDLYKQILIRALLKSRTRTIYKKLKTDDPDEIVEMACYETLKRIRKVLDNPELNDFVCVETIVALLEEIGSDGGSRHDF